MPGEALRNGGYRARPGLVNWENPQMIAEAGKDYSG